MSPKICNIIYSYKIHPLLNIGTTGACTLFLNEINLLQEALPTAVTRNFHHKSYPVHIYQFNPTPTQCLIYQTLVHLITDTWNWSPHYCYLLSDLSIKVFLLCADMKVKIMTTMSVCDLSGNRCWQGQHSHENSRSIVICLHIIGL